MTLQTILADNKHDLAMVIGNGINRYGDSATANSWEGLLLGLASKYGVFRGERIPEGIALTEFYDLLNLSRSDSVASQISLQEEFCAGMEEWQVFPHHQRIVKWSSDNAIPILTTNFDTVLSRAGGCSLLPEKIATSFTDYYPWNRYYGLNHIANPLQGFGIWHVNGMQRYRRSIRLGLTDYMGSVERVRGWIHRGKEGLLFAGKDAENWPGVSTWLHIVFNKPLLIFGLGLDENEVFLRWLLIERARYFKKYPSRRRQCWYVYTSEWEKEGKLFFLAKLGIQAVKADSYDDLYGASSWQ